jgi:hypothetical protein
MLRRWNPKHSPLLLNYFLDLLIVANWCDAQILYFLRAEI